MHLVARRHRRETSRVTTPRRPSLLVVGHVAEDHISGERRLGGAAAFAARAACALGVRTALLTAAPADFRLLRPLLDDPRLRLVRAEADAPTTFELDYSGPARRIRLLRRAPDLRPEDVPADLCGAPLAYVAPVCGEVGRAVLARLRAGLVVVGAQGWLRALAPGGEVVPALTPEAEDPPPGLDAVVFSELDHPDAEAVAAHFATRTPLVALTRGSRGATLLVGGRRLQVPAEPVAEVDPTGAGDVFGVVLGLGLLRGDAPLVAARHAARAAATVVEGPGLGRLHALRGAPGWPELAGAAGA